MDKIKLEGLKIFAHHGVYAEETEKGQHFYLTLTLETNTRPAGLADELEQSTDYGELALFADDFLKRHTFKLLETATEQLAREILLRFPLVQAVTVSLSKPEAPIPLTFADVAVTIRRSWHEAYIALGSNLGDKKGYLEDAIKALEDTTDVYVEAVSSLITTAPYGDVAQDDFLNGVVKVKTLLTPQELLAICHDIEAEAGRIRDIHWGPRTLDLDILFYDDLILHSDDLTIPHVDIRHRDFVLRPMTELSPGLVHPVYKKTMKDMLEDLEKENKCQVI